MYNENTIILLKGEARLTKREYRAFSKGDTVMGENCSPEELKRWSIEEKEQAEKELESYRCEYSEYSEMWRITEYALEYCECNEEGEFLQGSDFDLAKEDMLWLVNDQDSSIEFSNIEEAKRYYMPDVEEFPEEEEYATEIENADDLEELADVLNKYTDIFEDGSGWKVKRIAVETI